MNVERSRRFVPLFESLELQKAGYHAFRHFNVSIMDALRVPLKTIQERIGHALTGCFTLDVLDWKANEDTAKGLGEEIAKAVTKAESDLDSGPLTAHPKETLQTRDSEVSETK